MSKTLQTVIRMGAAHFDITLCGSERIDLRMIQRTDGGKTPITKAELSQVAEAVCRMHDIKGRPAKYQRKPSRPYKGNKPNRSAQRLAA